MAARKPNTGRGRRTWRASFQIAQRLPCVDQARLAICATPRRAPGRMSWRPDIAEATPCPILTGSAVPRPRPFPRQRRREAPARQRTGSSLTATMPPPAGRRKRQRIASSGQRWDGGLLFEVGCESDFHRSTAPIGLLEPVPVLLDHCRRRRIVPFHSTVVVVVALPLGLFGRLQESRFRSLRGTLASRISLKTVAASSGSRSLELWKAAAATSAHCISFSSGCSSFKRRANRRIHSSSGQLGSNSRSLRRPARESAVGE